MSSITGPRQQTHVRSEVDEERGLRESGDVLGVNVSLSCQPASRDTGSKQAQQTVSMGTGTYARKQVLAYTSKYTQECINRIFYTTITIEKRRKRRRVFFAVRILKFSDRATKMYELLLLLFTARAPK